MGLFSTTSIITTLLLSPIIRAQDGGDTCYFPDGSIYANGLPCSTDGGICCDSPDECLDNGLCAYTDPDSTTTTLFTRGSCTDPEWGSVCPDICVYREE